MRKELRVYFLLALYLAAVLCLLYAGALFVSGSTQVRFPDAMLPMQDWERGGAMLVFGLVPMFLVNLLCFLFVFQKDVPRLRRWLFFLPFAVEALLAAWGVVRSV